MASDGYMKKIQASLKMVFYVSTLLYLLGKGIGFITHHLNSIISRSSSQGRTDTNTRNNATYNQYFTLQVPVPYIDIKKLFGSSNDDSLSSSDQPKRIKGQYTVEYLNSMARRIDFLHQNYVRYLNKLTNDNTVMMMSSTTTAATDSITTFQKRIRPIVFKNKFNLAKDILMRDLNDTIVKCQWKTEMCRQQIKTVSKFIPPSFFLMDPKLSPYYWVLTDIDYKLMPPFLRNFVLYTNTSNINSTFNNAGLFSSTSTGYDGRMNPLQFSNNLPPTTTMFGNSSSSIIGGVPSQVVDRIRYDWKFFITQNRSISHRFEFLYNAFLTKQGLTVQNKQDRKNYLKEFENDCYKLLKKRRKVARNKIKTVRMKHLRPSEREKSQLKAQYNKLKQIELENRRFI